MRLVGFCLMTAIPVTYAFLSFSSSQKGLPFPVVEGEGFCYWCIPNPVSFVPPWPPFLTYWRFLPVSMSFFPSKEILPSDFHPSPPVFSHECGMIPDGCNEFFAARCRNLLPYSSPLAGNSLFALRNLFFLCILLMTYSLFFFFVSLDCRFDPIRWRRSFIFCHFLVGIIVPRCFAVLLVLFPASFSRGFLFFCLSYWILSLGRLCIVLCRSVWWPIHLLHAASVQIRRSLGRASRFDSLSLQSLTSCPHDSRIESFFPERVFLVSPRSISFPFSVETFVEVFFQRTSFLSTRRLLFRYVSALVGRPVFIYCRSLDLVCLILKGFPSTRLIFYFFSFCFLLFITLFFCEKFCATFRLSDLSFVHRIQPSCVRPLSP